LLSAFLKEIFLEHFYIRDLLRFEKGYLFSLVAK
jgi:hypothetical protein